MALNLANYKNKAADSVRTIWANQEKASAQRAKTSKGSARSNHMEGFVSLLTELVAANGPKDATVIQGGKTPLTLPGYFLPVRKWDLLVLRGNRLVATKMTWGRAKMTWGRVETWIQAAISKLENLA